MEIQVSDIMLFSVRDPEQHFFLSMFLLPVSPLVGNKDKEC